MDSPCHIRAQLRQQALELFQTGLDAVAGRQSVREALQAETPRRVWGVATGKAAAPMAQGALDAWGDRVERLLVITKQGHGAPLPAQAQLLESAHPVPDERSLEAGAALLDFLARVPADVGLLFLVSGGTSALVERLPDGAGSEQLAELNRTLLAGGQAIAGMNAVRKRVSCLKGGRLARYLGGRPTLQLLVSDVPEDRLDVIGSGMLVPDHSPPPDWSTLPDWVRRLADAAPPAPPPGDPAFSAIESRIIGSNGRAREAIGERARASGWRVFDHSRLLLEPPDRTADAIFAELATGADGVYLWGGEPAMVLPPEPGRGGRSQALALELAQRIRGRDDLVVLCGASDGTDGPTEDAGALVDGNSVARGEAEGEAVAEALRRADSGTFLEASGDLLQTGPTGTNVMDLVIALKRAR